MGDSNSVADPDEARTRIVSHCYLSLYCSKKCIVLTKCQDTVTKFTYAHSFRSQYSENCEMQRIKTRQTFEHKMEGCVLKKVPVQARLRWKCKCFQGILGLGQPCRSLENNGSRPLTSITATEIHSRWNTHLKTLSRQTTKYSGRQTPKRTKFITQHTTPQQSTHKTFATLRRFLPANKQTTLKQTLASHPLIQIQPGIIHLEEGTDLTD